MLKIYFVTMSALVVTQLAALPTGAPVSACKNMIPLHLPFLLSTQGSSDFATLTVSSLRTSPDSPIQVTLSTDGTDTFRGYLIQARTGRSLQPVGTFKVTGQSNSGKTINCPDGVANAVTHTSSADKTSETFLWTPPSKFKGQVIFRATVVRGYPTYYKGLHSEVVNVYKKG